MTTYTEIEILGSSLVREYLSRKGFKETLTAMDKEAPRDSSSVNNRLLLAQKMHMEKLMKRNKEHPKPLRAMIEVMVKYFLEKAGFPFRPPVEEAAIGEADKVPQKHGVEASWMEKGAQSTMRPKSAFNDPGRSSRSTEKPPSKVGRDAKDVALEEESGGEQMASKGYGATFRCFPKKPSDDDGIIHRTLFAEETLPSPEPRRYRGVSPEDPMFRQKPGTTLIPPKHTPSVDRGQGNRQPQQQPQHQPPSQRQPTQQQQQQRQQQQQQQLHHQGRARSPGKSLRKIKSESENVNINADLEDNENGNNSAQTKEGVFIGEQQKEEKEQSKTKDPVKKAVSNRPTMGGRPTSSRPMTSSRPLPPSLSNTSVTNNNNNVMNNSFNSNTNAAHNSNNNNVNHLVSPMPSSPSLSIGNTSSPKPSSISSSRSSSAGSDKLASYSANLQESQSRPEMVVDALEDIEDDMEEDAVPAAALAPPTKLLVPANKNAKPIDEDVARSLKLLIFGTSTSAASAFNEEWLRQDFSFCRRSGLEYGLVQKKGGPCGVLAAVQAALLKEMLFGEDQRWKAGKKGLSAVCCDVTQRATALARALARILWRAGGEKGAIVATPSGRTYFHHAANYTADKFTETLNLCSFDCLESLQQHLQSLCESQLSEDNFPAVVLILYSAILSRGLDNVQSDFDDPKSRLMGAHSYCTQEMVNLLLCGVAVSNVHNNTIFLGDPEEDADCVRLRGLHKQNHIGFLSLFEHYGNFEVGTYYKTPQVPIWVVCSESHFSVIFCINRELVSNWKAERRFDLFYYDGLANQEEEICLTVDTTDPDFKPPDEEVEMVPPLEHVIRTKWKDARVDWNGTEPLL